ncbi:SPASM domain-containing protein [Streptococcus thermophilus]
MFINSSGDVGFCPTLSSTKFCGGNINEKTLNDIWINSKFFNHIRNVRCKYYNECPANYVCQGGCRSRAQFFGGSIGSPDIQECKLAYNLTGIKPKSGSVK